MLQQATDEPAGRVGQGAVATLVVREGFAALPRGRNACACPTVVAERGLGMKDRGMTELETAFLMTYLNFIVSRGLQRSPKRELISAARASWWARSISGRPAQRQPVHVRVLVGGETGEIAALDGHLVARDCHFFCATRCSNRPQGNRRRRACVPGVTWWRTSSKGRMTLGTDGLLVTMPVERR